MHELSICESLLQTLETAAADQGFSEVRQVWIEIGELSCVEPDALRFCFEAVMRDTLAQGAQLNIRRVAGLARCKQCQAQVPVSSRYQPCCSCGSFDLELLAGDEMRVKELEVI